MNLQIGNSIISSLPQIVCERIILPLQRRVDLLMCAANLAASLSRHMAEFAERVSIGVRVSLRISGSVGKGTGERLGGTFGPLASLTGKMTEVLEAEGIRVGIGVGVSISNGIWRWLSEDDGLGLGGALDLLAALTGQVAEFAELHGVSLDTFVHEFALEELLDGFRLRQWRWFSSWDGGDADG